MYRCTGIQVYRYIGVQVYRYTGVQVYRYTGVQVYRCTGIQVYRCTGVEVRCTHRCGDVGSIGYTEAPVVDKTHAISQHIHVSVRYLSFLVILTYS